VVCDSTAFQFWGSEQYRLGVALVDQRSPAAGGRGHLFTARQMRRWARAARRLNRQGRGDQAAFFILRPIA